MKTLKYISCLLAVFSCYLTHAQWSDVKDDNLDGWGMNSFQLSNDEMAMFEFTRSNDVTLSYRYKLVDADGQMTMSSTYDITVATTDSLSRNEYAMAKLNGQVYVIIQWASGISNSGKRLVRHDPQTDTWYKVADLGKLNLGGLLKKDIYSMEDMVAYNNYLYFRSVGYTWKGQRNWLVRLDPQNGQMDMMEEVNHFITSLGVPSNGSGIYIAGQFDSVGQTKVSNAFFWNGSINSISAFDFHNHSIYYVNPLSDGSILLRGRSEVNCHTKSIAIKNGVATVMDFDLKFPNTGGMIYEAAFLSGDEFFCKKYDLVQAKDLYYRYDPTADEFDPIGEVSYAYSRRMYALDGKLFVIEHDEVNGKLVYRVRLHNGKNKSVHVRMIVDVDSNCSETIIDRPMEGIFPVRNTISNQWQFFKSTGVNRYEIGEDTFVIEAPDLSPYFSQTCNQNDTVFLHGVNSATKTLLFKPSADLGYAFNLITRRGWVVRQGFEERHDFQVQNQSYSKKIQCRVHVRIPDSFQYIKGLDQPQVDSGKIISWMLDLEPREVFNTAFWAKSPIGQQADFQDYVLYMDASCGLDPRDTIAFRVVRAYDPNDKQSNKSKRMKEGTKELEYLIRFQNTGNDTAYNIHILDTLSEHIDFSKMRIIQSSHPMDIEVHEDQGTGQYVLNFVFNDILLPDSTTDFDGSSGFIHYDVKLKEDFGIKDSVTNTAYIYFDYQLPVVTNTVVNGYRTDISITSIPLIEKGRILIAYPNPNNGRFTLENQSDKNMTVAVFSMHGKLIRRIQLAENANQLLDLGSQSAGVYYLVEEETNEVIRVIKQ